MKTIVFLPLVFLFSLCKFKFLLLILFVVCGSGNAVKAQNVNSYMAEASPVSLHAEEHVIFADHLNVFNENKKHEQVFKSDTKKTIGWIFIGGGVALASIGFFSPNKESPVAIDFRSQRTAVIILGGLSAVTSLVFIISKRRTAKYEGRINFASPQVIKMQENTLVSTQIPTLSVKVKL